MASTNRPRTLVRQPKRSAKAKKDSRTVETTLGETDAAPEVPGEPHETPESVSESGIPEPRMPEPADPEPDPEPEPADPEPEPVDPESSPTNPVPPARSKPQMLKARCPRCGKGVQSMNWAKIASWFGEHCQKVHPDVFQQLFSVASGFLGLMIAAEYDTKPDWGEQSSVGNMREDLHDILEGHLDPMDGLS